MVVTQSQARRRSKILTPGLRPTPRRRGCRHSPPTPLATPDFFCLNCNPDHVSVHTEPNSPQQTPAAMPTPDISVKLPSLHPLLEPVTLPGSIAQTPIDIMMSTPLPSFQIEPFVCNSQPLPIPTFTGVNMPTNTPISFTVSGLETTVANWSPHAPLLSPVYLANSLSFSHQRIVNSAIEDLVADDSFSVSQEREYDLLNEAINSQGGTFPRSAVNTASRTATYLSWISHPQLLDTLCWLDQVNEAFEAQSQGLLNLSAQFEETQASQGNWNQEVSGRLEDLATRN